MAKMTIRFSGVELENILAKALREDYQVDLLRVNFVITEINGKPAVTGADIDVAPIKGEKK